MGNKKSKKPWGGRFKVELDPLVQRYTRSVHLDRRLAPYDIQGSRAHVRMLAAQGIISRQDEESILEGLEQVEKEIESGEFPYRDELEDIHMNIEYRLQEIVGEAGSRIHAGRSRNDQVALDLKMFCLETAMKWQGRILDVQEALLGRAEELKSDLFPGWTHLQAAQPLSWGHYLLAFCEMLGRDFRRLAHYRQLHSYSPLGAGALAGSTLPLEPERTAQELGFSSSFANSYDVVGDRDFILELLQIACQLMLHLSRLAEDFIYFSSTAVSWIELPDRLCTGSSMMPQKKNPDVLELARGKSASVLGHAAAMAALIKGVPTSYHRDLQQDKEHLFAAVDTATGTLEVMPLLVSGFKVNKEDTREALERGFVMATDLAEYLLTKGVPFRTAHETVGKLVAYCLEKRLTLEQLPLDKLQEFAPECGPEVSEVLKPESALRRRSHKGSTGLVSVEQQLAHWKEWIQDAR
ncbi:argininosuccinate lyase [Acidobacteria bacterium AH-259-L09]|nr:argininosuccinate lyase [Acidobacteria bacterium AH-259-L09]